jgi:hypothetical protein
MRTGMIVSTTLASTSASDDLKRCTKCREEKPRAEFSRDRSRKDGRYPQCKACVRRWHQENAERLAGTSSALRIAATGSASARTLEYRERRRANARRRDRERRAQDADYVERQRQNNRRYRERKRTRTSRTRNDG